MTLGYTFREVERNYTALRLVDSLVLYHEPQRLVVWPN